MTTKRVGVLVAAGACLLLAGIFVVQHLLDADAFRGRIEATLSGSLGRPVALGHLDFSLLSESLLASAPSIAEDPAFGAQPFLTAEDVRIGVDVAALLFHHELHIAGFTIDEPKITLLRKADGTWNYSSIGGVGKRKAPTAETNDLIPNLVVGKIDVHGATLTVGALPGQGPPHVYGDLDVSAQNFSFAGAFSFNVSGKLPNGGSLDISGTAGPISERDASLTPLTAQVSLKHADLVAAGLVDASQGIAGIADLDAKVVSNGQTAQVDGKLHASELKLAKNGVASRQPVDVEFSVSQDMRLQSGTITSAKVKVGAAALEIAGTYETRGSATVVHVKVNGQGMPIDALESFVPSLGVQLPAGSRLRGGTLTTVLDVSGPTTALVVRGPVRVANTRLAGFNLGQKLSSIQSLTGAKTGSDTTIQKLDADLRYGPEGTRTENLVAVVTGMGSATGSGMVSPGGALNYHLLVKLDSSGVGGVATKAVGLLGSAASLTAKGGIPVTIGGTTASPTFTPDMGKMLTGAIETKGKQAGSVEKALGGLFQHK